MSLDQVSPGRPAAIADALSERFAREYGVPSLGVFRAPGRVNLIGEHLDYNDGLCLPIALPHATYAALAARDDDEVRVTSLQQDQPWSGQLEALGPGDVDGWAAYVAGVVWALRQLGWDLPGLDIMVDSRVPVGSGLSSSAALECSVALGLCAVAGTDADDEVRRALVTACMRAETEVAGAPTGGMDQTVSLFAQPQHALLLDCRDGSTRQVPWDPSAAELELLVVDTRSSHTLSDGGYESRRRDCESAADSLGVASLREVDDADAALSALPDERVRRRARHVFSEMGRVRESVDQIGDADFAGLGRTFCASHASMRDDFEISTPELDAVVDTAVEHGALGARMTGGGFGGSAIALVPRAQGEAVRAAIGAEFDRRGWPSPGFLSAEPSAGANRTA
ncbi:MAG TPA: galactokinase [Nocardioidaceae bacterium]|nr:galactokinase [Nocardioidaceae bacterium]